MRKFKVGIDSYTVAPLNLSPFELLDWAIMNGADGVQFSEINLPPNQAVDRAFLLDLKSYAAENRLYLEWGGGEHIPLDLATGREKDIFSANREAAEQASILGVKSIRSCSGGLMRWNKDSLPTGEYLKRMAVALKAQKSMLLDYGVVLAIEMHFEFTSFELLRLFEMCGARPGEHLGICLDTMNLLTMLEDPVSATERLLPWITTTHIKDGGILLSESGFVSFPVEAGKGIVDFPRIFAMLSELAGPVHLSLEDHGGDFRIPLFDPDFLAEFPDLTVQEFARLLALAARSRELVKTGKIVVLDRAAWPRACELRAKRGLRAIRRIAENETA